MRPRDEDHGTKDTDDSAGRLEEAYPDVGPERHELGLQWGGGFTLTDAWSRMLLIASSRISLAAAQQGSDTLLALSCLWTSSVAAPWLLNESEKSDVGARNGTRFKHVLVEDLFVELCARGVAANGMIGRAYGVRGSLGDA